MHKPLVSVIIPAYNAAECIAGALDSVLAQTLCEFEILVVDDGSNDGTATVLASFGDRLQLLTQPNSGPAAARNKGLQHARGEFVAFLDADDRWLPTKLERQVALLRSRPEIGFCSTATAVVDAAGAPVADWPCCAGDAVLPELLFMRAAAISGSTSGVVARRALVLEVGGFDERLRGFEDPDLWIRLSARTRYACVAETLTLVVRTAGSVSSQLPRMRRATLASFRKNRSLLPARLRGAYWRAACASAIADYAKMAWRAGDRWRGLTWALEVLWRAPVARGRLALGLLVVMMGGRPL